MGKKPPALSYARNGNQQNHPPTSIDVFGHNIFATNRSGNTDSDISGFSSIREGSVIGSTLSSLTAGTAAGIRRKSAHAFALKNNAVYGSINNSRIINNTS